MFVEKNNEVVGFMLWYPDFNQLMNPKETVGLKTVIKNKLYGKNIDTFKIVEIGVAPEERNKGAILALFDYCFKIQWFNQNNLMLVIFKSTVKLSFSNTTFAFPLQ